VPKSPGTPGLPAAWTERLALPVICAPMFLVSGPELVLAACRAGIMGSFPAPNARKIEDLDAWLARIGETLAAERRAAPAARIAPYALNMVVHSSYGRLEAELDLVKKHKPPLVITALGSPRNVIEAVHAYGGKVFADVISLRFARKAIDAGVDGLILVAAGAGGHTGALAGFAFLPEIRRVWNGPVVLAGAISNGRAVRAVETLGADLVYMGTRFIAARESLAGNDYRDMLIGAGAEDIVLSAAITGVPANFLAASLAAAGYDPKDVRKKVNVDFAGDPQGEAKAWKHIWSAGQGVGAVTRVESVAEIVAQLRAEYAEAVAEGRGPNRWLDAPGAAPGAGERRAAE
jgi:nitronate monooxygenase